MGDNKKLIVSIICSLMLLISGTYAAMTFLTEKTDVTMVVDGDEISFNAGDSMTVEGIMPVYSMEEVNSLIAEADAVSVVGQRTFPRFLGENIPLIISLSIFILFPKVQKCFFKLSNLSL